MKKSGKLFKGKCRGQANPNAGEFGRRAAISHIIKKTACLLIILTMLLPSGSFAASADPAGWSTFGAKYSSRTKLLLTVDNSSVKETGFDFYITDKGAIKAEIPNYTTSPGIGGTAVISSEKTESLDSLTVVIEPDEFDFTLDESGIGNQISLLWTQLPLYTTENPILYTETEYNPAHNKGLRNLIPEGGKGLCITVGNTNEANNGTQTASDVSIVYYDGSYLDERSNKGYEWSFTKTLDQDHIDGIMPLIYDPDGDVYPIYKKDFESIDITYGLVISIRSDDESGYIVNINGKDYADKDDKIDLSALKTVKEGYITVGAVTNSDKYTADNISFELSSINSMTAKEWATGDNDPVCMHMYEDELIAEATCVKNGKIKYTCLFCEDSYIKSIPATEKHIFTNYVSNNDASCSKDGTKTAICATCTKTDTVTVAGSMKPHTPGDWVIIKEADYNVPGEKVIYCSVCNKETEKADIPALEYPFKDITNENAWYFEGIEYCKEKGCMIGDSNGYFNPGDTLTREQYTVILARIAGAEIDSYEAAPFEDVDNDSWYSEAVNWAYGEGIINGIGNGKFGVGKDITREELATMLFRYAKDDTVYPNGLEEYTDRFEISSWAKDAVNWTVCCEVLNSTDINVKTIAPKMKVTRAQAAQIIKNIG